MKTRFIPSKHAKWQTLRPSRALSLGIASLVLAISGPARSQQPPKPAESIVDAARSARQRKSNSAAPPVVFTNDDLAAQSPSPSAAPATPPASSSQQAEALTQQLAEVPAPQVPVTTDCNKPDAQRLNAELQAARDELDQLRRELSYDPQVISGGNLDMTNFKSGSSGVAFGSPPLLQSQPQAPARISEVILEERVASLKETSRIACEPPKDAAILRQLDAAEKELKLSQRDFDLNQAAYYSKPNYAQDSARKAALDAAQQQIESLQSEVKRLKDALPPPTTNPVAQ